MSDESEYQGEPVTTPEMVEMGKGCFRDIGCLVIVAAVLGSSALCYFTSEPGNVKEIAGAVAVVFLGITLAGLYVDSLRIGGKWW